MAQDLINKHWVAEISRVSAVYGHGHILSGEMDKDRDNGEIVAVGNYKEGEYYTKIYNKYKINIESIWDNIELGDITITIE